MSAAELLPTEPFDFVRHARQAEGAYQRVRQRYQDFAECLRSVLVRALDQREIKVASVEARAKSVDSFGRKASIPDEADRAQPKYRMPLDQITDLAGVRVIAFLPRSVDSVSSAIEEEFEVIEKTDKAVMLRQEERFGYTSVHYLVKLNANRINLPEYVAFSGLVGEIQ